MSMRVIGWLVFLQLLDATLLVASLLLDWQEVKPRDWDVPWQFVAIGLFLVFVALSAASQIGLYLELSPRRRAHKVIEVFLPLQGEGERILFDARHAKSHDPKDRPKSVDWQNDVLSAVKEHAPSFQARLASYSEWDSHPEGPFIASLLASQDTVKAVIERFQQDE